MNALSEIIADEVESVSNIKVFNFDPKATRTKMRSLAYPAENPNTIKEPLKLMDYYLWMLSEDSSSSNEIHIEYRVIIQIVTFSSSSTLHKKRHI